VKPERAPGEKHRFEIAKRAVSEHGAQAVVVLRHLLIHRKLVFRTNAVQSSVWATTPLPSGMTKDEALHMLNLLIHSEVVTCTQTSYLVGRKRFMK